MVFLDTGITYHCSNLSCRRVCFSQHILCDKASAEALSKAFQGCWHIFLLKTNAPCLVSSSPCCISIEDFKVGVKHGQNISPGKVYVLGILALFSTLLLSFPPSISYLPSQRKEIPLRNIDMLVDVFVCRHRKAKTKMIIYIIFKAGSFQIHCNKRNLKGSFIYTVQILLHCPHITRMNQH